MDENENETAGRGMIANREIKEGDELFTLPINLLLTKDAAKKVGVIVLQFHSANPEVFANVSVASSALNFPRGKCNK